MFTPLRTAIALVRTLAATTLLVAGLVGLAQGVVTTPAPLADGSEIVVTDRQGDHLLGYGRVEGGVLRLSFAERDDDGLAVMVIDPQGRLSTLVGRFATDGLRVRPPGAAQELTLASWLSERGVRLTLDPARSSEDDDDDRDDDRADDDDRDDDRDDGSDDGGPDDDHDDAPPDDGDDRDDADDGAGDDDANDDRDDGSDDDAEADDDADDAADEDVEPDTDDETDDDDDDGADDDDDDDHEVADDGEAADDDADDGEA